MTITRRLRFATLEHGFSPTQCPAPARRPKNDAAAVWQKDGALPSSLAKIVMAASRWATSAWLTGLVVNRAVDFVAHFAEGFSGAAVGHETFFTQMGYWPLSMSAGRFRELRVLPFENARNQNVAGALMAWTAPDAPQPLTLMGPTKAPRVCCGAFFLHAGWRSIVIFYRSIKIDNGNGFSSVPPL